MIDTSPCIDMIGVLGQGLVRACDQHDAELAQAIDRRFAEEINRISAIVRAGEVLGYPVILV